MKSPRRPAMPYGPRPLAAVAAVAALAMWVPGMTSTAGESAGTGSRAGAHWAVTVSGQRVMVAKPRFIPTPVHPERITHPGADSMGAVTVAHAPGPRLAKIRPALSTSQLPGIDISAYQGKTPVLDGKISPGEWNDATEFFGVTDFSESSLKILHDASPVNRVRKQMPPFLFIHGTADKTRLFRSSLLLSCARR